MSTSQYDFPQWSFSLYFLQSLPSGCVYPHAPGSDQAHAYLWSTPGVTLELTHNHASSEVYHPGNAERDGFGHLAFSVPDLAAAVAFLDSRGVLFKKRPEEGRMRSIAFAYDPDKYWVELVERELLCDVQGVAAAPQFALAQTMIRVRDPVASLAFYTERLGMTLVRKAVNDSFTTYFLATLPGGAAVPTDVTGPAAKDYLKRVLYPASVPVLELTHNHGTESQPDFKHLSGNEEGRRGFGHLGFLVTDVHKTFQEWTARGVTWHKTPDEGTMKGLAFAKDPDGYLIELIRRGQPGKF